MSLPIRAVSPEPSLVARRKSRLTLRLSHTEHIELSDMRIKITNVSRTCLYDYRRVVLFQPCQLSAEMGQHDEEIHEFQSLAKKKTG